jgi:hypothetical protein
LSPGVPDDESSTALPPAPERRPGVSSIGQAAGLQILRLRGYAPNR